MSGIVKSLQKKIGLFFIGAAITTFTACSINKPVTDSESLYYNAKKNTIETIIEENTAGEEEDRVFDFEHLAFSNSYGQNFDRDGVIKAFDPWPYTYGPFIDVNGDGIGDIQISGFSNFDLDNYLFDSQNWLLSNYPMQMWLWQHPIPRFNTGFNYGYNYGFYNGFNYGYQQHNPFTNWFYYPQKKTTCIIKHREKTNVIKYNTKNNTRNNSSRTRIINNTKKITDYNNNRNSQEKIKSRTNYDKRTKKTYNNRTKTNRIRTYKPKTTNNKKYTPNRSKTTIRKR